MAYGAFWLTLVLPGWRQVFGVENTSAEAMGCYLRIWGLFSLVNFLQVKRAYGYKIAIRIVNNIIFLLAAANFTVSTPKILNIAGWVGIVCGLIAFYEASAIMINKTYEKNILPL